MATTQKPPPMKKWRIVVSIEKNGVKERYYLCVDGCLTNALTSIGYHFTKKEYKATVMYDEKMKDLWVCILKTHNYDCKEEMYI